LGILVILIPVIFFSINNTIPYFFNRFSMKNNNKFQNKSNNITQPEKIHFVKEGEDLWAISEQYYGSGYYAFQIAKYNALKEPYTLVPNQKILIPTIQPTTIEAVKGDILQEAASTQRSEDLLITYTVKEGDSLFQIAQNVYGDGNYMNKIIIANNLSYPYNIEIGQQLLIPR